MHITFQANNIFFNKIIIWDTHEPRIQIKKNKNQISQMCIMSADRATFLIFNILGMARNTGYQGYLLQ